MGYLQHSLLLGIRPSVIPGKPDPVLLSPGQVVCELLAGHHQWVLWLFSEEEERNMFS